MDDDERLTKLRAMAHPARLQILSLLTGAAMSAAEVAREIGTTQANASYHLRRLHDAGEIELVEEVRIRGGTARRFRHVPFEPDLEAIEAHHRDGGPTEQQFYAALAQELLRRAGARVRAPHGMNVDAELWVPAQVWDEAVRQVSRLSYVLHHAALPPRSPDAVRTNTTIAMFAMDPTARPLPPEVAEGEA